MEAAINFIRKYGHLGNPSKRPDFVAEDFPECMDCLAASYPWYRSDPNHYQPAMSGDDIYKSDYNRVSLPRILESEFERMPLAEIPDSEEFVLIDIGSHLGRRVTRPFARAKPNVKVFMVDKLTKEDLENPFNYKAVPRNDIAGEELRVRVPVTANIEDSVNNLMRANGYHNITYIQRVLTRDSFDLGIEDGLRQRRVVVTGFQNPRGLGNITARVAIEIGAEKVFLNNSALEKIDPDSENYELMRGYLSEQGLSPSEIRKVIDLIYDPEYKTRGPTEKYDRQDKGQRWFSSALKLLFVLAQKDLLERNGYQVKISQNSHPYGPGWYNGPSQNIVATK